MPDLPEIVQAGGGGIAAFFMMKQVIYHWVEIHILEVPDEAPTDDIYHLFDWIDEQGKEIEDYTVSSNTRDCEIVDIQ